MRQSANGSARVYQSRMLVKASHYENTLTDGQDANMRMDEESDGNEQDVMLNDKNEQDSDELMDDYNHPNPEPKQLNYLSKSLRQHQA